MLIRRHLLACLAAARRVMGASYSVQVVHMLVQCVLLLPGA